MAFGNNNNRKVEGKKRFGFWSLIAWAGSISLLSAGCMNPQMRSEKPIPVPKEMNVASKKMAPKTQEANNLKLVSNTEVSSDLAQAKLSNTSSAIAEKKPRQIPINLDTVLRLAEEQNPQIMVMREKVEESNAENALAAKSWLPSIYGGIAYYRHEGGIQNFNGDLIKSSTGALYPNIELRTELDLREATYKQIVSERNSWQTRGELTKITVELCLEAATAYIDLLTARRGEAIARELEKYHLEQLKRAEKMKENHPDATVLVEAVYAELNGRKQAILKLKQQGDSSAVKLAFLLGVDPDSELVPVEENFVPLDLVDVSVGMKDMVAKSLSYGPGIRELERMLENVQDGIARMEGPTRLMPILQVNMAEGGFGAGANSSLYWANRWDMGLAAKWNLTEWHTSREKRRIAEVKLNQVQLTFKELQAKLSAGVQDARDSIINGREQIQYCTKQIQHSAETYRLNTLRLEQNAPNATMSDVLLSIRGLEMAHANYVGSINAYNRSQVRLMLLLGPNNATGSENAAVSNQKNNRKYEIPKEGDAPLRLSLDKSTIENR